jgi:hypothetical protein
MGAFIVEAIVFAITCAVSAIMLFSSAMSDSPSAAEDVPVLPTFFTGSIIAVLIVFSHWLPHIGW